MGVAKFTTPLVVTTAALAKVASPPAIAAPESSAPSRDALDADRQWAEMREFIHENPLDFVGIDELAYKYTGRHVITSVSGAGQNLNAEEVMVILEARAALPSGTRPQSKVVQPLAVPVDAFTTTFSWIPRPNTGNFPYAAYGTWDFRDDFVNFSPADDTASNSWSSTLPDCQTITGNHVATYQYDGVETTGVGWIRDQGASTRAPIAGIRDDVSGFVGNADHGYLLTDMENSCGPSTMQGQFIYEHSQDGGSVVGVSAGWGALSVSYSGSPSTLQKASNLATRTG